MKVSSLVDKVQSSLQSMVLFVLILAILFVNPFALALLVAPLQARAYDAGAANAKPVQLKGAAYVQDGDTLKIGNQWVRMVGIDAPEIDQSCSLKTNPTWACGAEAASELHRKVAGQTVTCIGKQFDLYKRLLATCYLGTVPEVPAKPAPVVPTASGTAPPRAINLNQWMVRSGWATAYRYFSHIYVADEDYAKSRRQNIWSSHFIEPYYWRKSHPKNYSSKALSR